MDCGEILDASSKGEMDAVYILGEDVVSMYPDAGFARGALSRAGFIVVQDIFLTETAKMADVVLPGASYAEKDGTFTNQEGRVQRIRKAVQPVNGVRGDLDILCSIGGFGYKCAGDVFDEIKREAPAYKDITFDALDGKGAMVKGQTPDARHQTPDTRHQTPDTRHQTPDTRYQTKDNEYPFQLITGNHLLHSGKLSQKALILKQLLPEPFVEISGEDAMSLGVNDGDMVTVKGRHNTTRLKVRVKHGSVKGAAFIAENFEDIPVNLFFKKGEGIPRVKIIK